MATCSGYLQGILRGLALERGLAMRQLLQAEDPHRAEAVLLGNSLGSRPAQAFEGSTLKGMTPRQAEALWRELLECEREARRP